MSTKAPLKLSAVRRALEASVERANAAVILGKQKVEAARKAGRKEDVKKNLAALAIARKAKRNLPAVARALNDSCCNQIYNCDPQFEP